jgi:hypothetical protein
MPIISGGQQMPGLRMTGSGVPGAGTDEVQTLTIGGTPTGGTFTITFGGFTTAAITWTATDATLVSNIDAALEALPNIGTGGVTTAAGTVSSGIGTITLTFAGADKTAKRAQPLAVATSSLTGTNPTVVIAETTPGVTATGFGTLPGGIYHDTTNGKAYVNTGTAAAPAWTVVGSAT